MSTAAPAGPLRVLWLAAGLACLAIGTVGIVLPLLPTVDFYVLAAWCFARGSRRWERWLLAHPRIGPLVLEWRARRALPLQLKWCATASMSLGCAWLAYAGSPRAALIVALACSAVAAYLWTRPTLRRA